MQPQKLSLPMW